MPNHSFLIISVDLECSSRYLSHNIVPVYMPKNLEFVLARERLLIRDCAGCGSIFWLNFKQVKPDISVKQYYTVRRAEKIMEIGLDLLENEKVHQHIKVHTP